MLERDIESTVCKRATAKGVLNYKFTSPARRMVPDRIFILPSGFIFFIEFKRTGVSATICQQREHERLRHHKVKVFVVDSVTDGNLIIDSMLQSYHDWPA